VRAGYQKLFEGAHVMPVAAGAPGGPPPGGETGGSAAGAGAKGKR